MIGRPSRRSTLTAATSRCRPSVCGSTTPVHRPTRGVTDAGVPPCRRLDAVERAHRQPLRAGVLGSLDELDDPLPPARSPSEFHSARVPPTITTWRSSTGVSAARLIRRHHAHVAARRPSRHACIPPRTGDGAAIGAVLLAWIGGLCAMLPTDHFTSPASWMATAVGHAARNLPRTAGHTEGEENLAAVVRLAVEARHRLADRVRLLHRELGSPARRGSPHPRPAQEAVRPCRRAQRAQRPRAMDRPTVRRPRARTPRYVQRAIEKAIADTASNTGMVLTVAFDYGSRAEIVHAADAASKQAAAEGRRWSRPPTSTRTCTCPSCRRSTSWFARRASGASPTSCSGRSAGAPVYFTEQTWPDFGADELDAAIAVARR